MPKCPFAKQKPISGGVGPHVGGPFKIVHHTTEGSSAAGAFAAFAKNKSDPHFTVDATDIYQHIDTALAARALKNAPGGVQTNRDSAIQIEVVGFAHKPKGAATLRNVARLCRWIEKVHGVPQVWPNGPPKPAVNGRDPGGHNRDARNWDTKSGHYGHSNVPENSHWDPGYTAAEVKFLMEFDPDAHKELGTALESAPGALIEDYSGIEADADLSDERSTMPDHSQVGPVPGE